jgi:hypothetical protein
MIKLKQQILSILFSILFSVGITFATECTINISNDSGETLSGYTLRVQLAGEDNSPHTQTIDLSEVPALNSQSFELSSDLTDNLDLGDNKACISLYDPQGKRMTECLNLEWIDHFPVLQIKINARKKLASVETPRDLVGMALLAAHTE